MVEGGGLVERTQQFNREAPHGQQQEHYILQLQLAWHMLVVQVGYTKEEVATVAMVDG